MENDMSSSDLNWLIVDHQGEVVGDEVNKSNHSSRRNSSSSGASGGFVKIDDNQVEACGEEQRSMHEYAADVVNQLMLPIHSSSDSMNTASPRDEALSSDESSFGEVEMQRRQSTSSLSHDEEEVKMAVLSDNHEMAPMIDAANAVVDMEEVAMRQPATPSVPIALAIETDAADQSANDLHDALYNAAENLEDSKHSADDLKEAPPGKDEGYADKDQAVDDSEVLIRGEEGLVRDNTTSVGLELSSDASSNEPLDNSSGSLSYSWEIAGSTSSGEEKGVGGGTRDEQLISGDMACPIRPPPQTFAAQLCFFLSVLIKLCYESVHSKLRSTMSISSSTIAALLILVLGFSAGYRTGYMYDTNSRQALADNLKICAKGFDDLEVVRDRLAKCNEQQDSIWNGLNHQFEQKFEAEKTAWRENYRVVTWKLTREKEELQQVVIDANRQLNDLRIENDDLRRVISKLRYARPAEEDSAKVALGHSVEDSDAVEMSEDETDALNWGRQQQQDSSQASKDTKGSAQKQSAGLDNSCWFYLWTRVQNLTSSTKQGTPLPRSELDSFFKDFTTCVSALESDITANGEKSSAFTYLPFIASSLWAQMVMMESRTPPTQPYPNQGEGATVVNKVNDLLQRCWKAMSNPKHARRAFEATKDSLGRLRELFNETVHGEAVRSTVNMAKDTAASLAHKMDSILGKMQSFVGGIFGSKTKKNSGLDDGDKTGGKYGREKSANAKKEHRKASEGSNEKKMSDKKAKHDAEEDANSEKKSDGRKANTDEQIHGHEKAKKKKVSMGDGEKKSGSNTAKTKEQKHVEKMAKRAEYENRKKQEKAGKRKSFAHDAAYKFEQSRPDCQESTTHPCHAKCPLSCGSNTRQFGSSTAEASDGGTRRGWRQYFADKWNKGKQRLSTWWRKQGQGQGKNEEDLGHSCSSSCANEEEEVVIDDSSQQKDAQEAEAELQQQWEAEPGDGFDDGVNEEYVDWFSKRAADREFQRDKPWYYRRAEDRANSRQYNM